jgi:hypothetical protein
LKVWQQAHFERPEHICRNNGKLGKGNTMKPIVSAYSSYSTISQGGWRNSTYFWPRHILAPLEKVHRYCSRDFAAGVNQRSGLNTRASGPHISSLVCIVYADIETIVYIEIVS